MAETLPKLFQPIEVGEILLSHHIAMAPLTRVRADTKHVQLPHVKEYYGQRASEPGTLIVAEATYIAEKAGGIRYVPGIWSDEQIAAWKEIVDTVHAKGSFVYLQLWALGRAANPDALEAEGPHPYVSASPVQLSTKSHPPRALTIDEIQEYVQLYATAASNAVHRAGFDGVEIHSANGYLLDQFLQDVSNKRTDEYGGSVENRIRFALEVVEAVTKAVGQKKTGIRFSPWSRFQDMGMKDPVPTFTALISRLHHDYPDFAYVHLVEPRVDGSRDREGYTGPNESNDFIREIWRPRPLISAGGYGYSRELALNTVEEKGDIIAYGRPFISNPDLIYKVKNDLPLTKPNRDHFYSPAGTTDPIYYTDYPFAPRGETKV